MCSSAQLLSVWVRGKKQKHWVAGSARIGIGVVNQTTAGKSMENIFTEIDKSLQQGRRMVLARIIRQVGSAPRGTGTKCLIMEDGTLKGTIGGGLLEYQVMEKAGEILENGCSETLHFKLTGTELAKSEMLCGGLADVYLEPLFPDNPAVVELFGHIVSLLAEGRSGVLITQIVDGRPHGDTTGRLLIAGDGARTGTIDGLSAKDLRRLLKKPATAMVNAKI
jgi:xanthine dehydrogenase accessory factor